MAGPSAKQTGVSASARPLVTASLELGFTTRIRRRGGPMLASSSICRHCWRQPLPSSRAKAAAAAREYRQMPEIAFDCVLRGGRVATAIDDFDADVAIKDGVIVAIGRNLGRGAAEIDAQDRLLLPGGVDAHAHIEQLSAAGIVNSDTFESATVSAAHGGTTSVICFAAQHRGMNLQTVVGDYLALARKGAVIDYAFHMIIADPTEVTLKEHVPALVMQGHSTLKVFMTYDLLNVGDEKLLDILLAARHTRPSYACMLRTTAWYRGWASA